LTDLKKIFGMLLAAWVLVPCVYAANQCPVFQLQKGDILFSDIPCGEFCDAIDGVTQRKDTRHMNHVGMVIDVNAQGEGLIMEAVTKGVGRISASDFLKRSRHDANGCPQVAVGRVEENYRKLVPAAITWIKAQEGMPYNRVFIMNDKGYYCSELVYRAFEEANNGHPVFKLHTITFKSPETHDTLPAWKAYYRALNTPIPEGTLGNSPVSLSEDDHLNIVFWYGDFSDR
jgi:uncharacterized protein YycO